MVALLIWAAATFAPDLGRPWLPLGTFGFQTSNDGLVEHVDPDVLASPRGCIAPKDRIEMRRSPAPDPNLIALLGNNDGPLNYVWSGHPPLDLHIDRAGRTHECRIGVEAAPPRPWFQWLPVFLQDLFGGVFIYVCARIVWQHPLPATWGLFIYSIWFNPALNFASYAELQRWPSLVLLEEALQSIVQSAGYVGLIVFAAQFPDRTVAPRRRRVYRWSLSAVGALLLLLQLATFGTAFGFQTARITEISYWSGVAVDVAFGIILFARYPMMQPTDKQRTRWVLWGCLGLLAYLFADATESTDLFSGLNSALGQDPGKIECALALPYTLSILLPLAVSVAIRQSRVFHVRLLLSRITTYGFVLAVLLGAALAIEETLKHFLEEQPLIHTLGWSLSLIILATVTFGGEHVRGTLLGSVKRLFFPQVYRFERELHRVREEFEACRTESAVDARLVGAAVEGLQIASAAIFRHLPDTGFCRTAGVGWSESTSTRIPPGRVLSELQHRRDPLRLDEEALTASMLTVPSGTGQPVVAIPVRDGDLLLAIALYGAHKKGDDLLDEELSLLAQLADYAATAYLRSEARGLREQVSRAALRTAT